MRPASVAPQASDFHDQLAQLLELIAAIMRMGSHLHLMPLVAASQAGQPIPADVSFDEAYMHNPCTENATSIGSFISPVSTVQGPGSSRNAG